MSVTGSQVTILPAQIRRLASVSRDLDCALGISQDGSILHIDTGTEKFSINADGENLKYPNQETLC